MTVQSITLNLPDSLYRRLQRQAEQTKRSLETELLEAVATALPANEQLADDLEEAIASLSLLNDEALWRVARSRLPADTSTQLENLHWKQQREGLTPPEAELEASLAHQYERQMLVRAQAAVLLKQRGYDISELGPQV